MEEVGQGTLHGTGWQWTSVVGNCSTHTHTPLNTTYTQVYSRPPSCRHTNESTTVLRRQDRELGSCTFIQL